ncbi:MAG: SDR family oxidoreductase [Methylococcaceae bacterium]|nr:SDR family oxidoreductase [Methylococcaceae bacterium]
MATVLITGANRGLGLEFCKQYAAEGWHVIACCRDPKAATDLMVLAAHHSRMAVFPLDMTDFLAIERLSAELATLDVDVLINNAGVYGDTSEHGFGDLDYASWSKTLTINVQAPVKMTEMFLPQLKRGGKKLVVAISSLMGSMADNGSGGSIVYRSSKAALNAAMKSIALEVKAQGIGVLIFHPGWVKTDMGGSNAPLAAAVSIKGMRQIIDEFTLAQSGHFIKYDGTPMPW